MAVTREEEEANRRKLHGMMVERAKRKDPAERDLLQTLIAADVPVERALDLVGEETGQAIRGTLAQYAWLIRDNRMAQLPEGSEERRRLGMIADMLDPSAQDSWEFPRAGKGEV
jgi:hypothetical protein